MWVRFVSTAVYVFSLALLVNWAEGGDGVPYQSESWNEENPIGLGSGDEGPPAGGENLWAYWDEDFEPDPPEEAGGNYHHRPMRWSSSGGVGDSGYVWTPLSEVMTEHNEIQAYWPAYMTDQQTSYYNYYYKDKSPHPRHLDLTIENALITASLRDLEDVSTSDNPEPVNLDGGKIRFFVGKWWHDDLKDDAFIFFYNNNGEFQVSGSDWTTSSVPVGNGTASADDWPVIASSKDMDGFRDPPSDGDEAYEHFDSPQQWGFVIHNPAASVTPNISGELGFDDFAVVPEPSAFVLLGIGFFLVFWCLRRTQD